VSYRWPRFCDYEHSDFTCLADAIGHGCAGSVAELAAAATPGAASPAGDALREHLAELFRQFDADGNGRLDVGEFREAMKHMGNELSAASVRSLHEQGITRRPASTMNHQLKASCSACVRQVNVMFSSLDIHGWVGLDQFVEIVEVRSLCFILIAMCVLSSCQAYVWRDAQCGHVCRLRSCGRTHGFPRVFGQLVGVQAAGAHCKCHGSIAVFSRLDVMYMTILTNFRLATGGPTCQIRLISFFEIPAAAERLLHEHWFHIRPWRRKSS